MNVATFVTVNSEVMPGVSWDVRLISEGMRTKILVGLAEAMISLRTVQVEMHGVDVIRTEEGNVDEVNTRPEVMKVLLDLNDKISRITRLQINPVWFREGLLAIRGIEFDGVSDTPLDKLPDLLPEQLYDEILKSIRAASELSMTERSSLGSATTLNVLAGGLAISTSAEPVVPTDSTSSETVTSTSPTT